MADNNKFIVSHAPFWHDGSRISTRNYNIALAALPAILLGIIYYGMPAVGVVSLSISSAIIWEFVFCRVTKHSVTIGDGSAAIIGMIFGMLLPATAPWWLVILGTFVAVIIGKQIYGGIGACIRSSTTITNVAIITIKQAILTFEGIMFRSNETSIFEHTRTKTTAIPIPSPFSTDLVTARTGQRPNTSLNGGISSHKPLTNS